MNTHISIDCPERADDEDFGLVKFFNEKIEELKPALDLTVEDLDERACFYGVEIVDVQEDDSGVVIQYDVTYSAYYGCRDQDHSGVYERDVAGDLRENTWVFPVYIPPPRRTTYEEF